MVYDDFLINKDTIQGLYYVVFQNTQYLEREVNEIYKKRCSNEGVRGIMKQLDTIKSKLNISKEEYNNIKEIMRLRNLLAHEFFINPKCFEKVKFKNIEFTSDHKKNLSLVAELINEVRDYIESKKSKEYIPNMIEGTYKIEN